MSKQVSFSSGEVVSLLPGAGGLVSVAVRPPVLQKVSRSSGEVVSLPPPADGLVSEVSCVLSAVLY
jgi:hypothetical protein